MPLCVTPENFSLSMQKLGTGDLRPNIAVAVSGGGDSMALALLMQDWIKETGGRLLALTVDHGLRPESAAEAQTVHDLLSGRGIEHRTLRWTGEKPATHVQERAREARYRLLIDCCRAENINVLAVAHHREDQIETFWMRLAHGSGLDGLAAMARQTVRDGTRIIRPLLDFSREELRETCRRYGVAWIEDPSNAQQKYLRPRLRGFEDVLAAEGLTPERLGQTLQKLEESCQALKTIAKSAFDACAVLHEEGYITLDRAGWRSQPRDIRRRMLNLALEKFSLDAYSPDFESLTGLIEAMDRPDFTGRTLHGCEIVLQGKEDFLICREEAAAEPPVFAVSGMIWDRRFTVFGDGGESFTLGMLGEDGIAYLRLNLSKGHPVLRRLEALPFRVRKTLPVLRHGDNIVFVQHLDCMMPEYAPVLSGVRLTSRMG